MTATVHVGHVLDILPTLESGSVNCVVTSPPYWGLRDYGVAGQFGLEPMPEEYVANMVAVFHEVKRVLRDDGTLWLNLGDTYASAWPCQRRNEIGAGSLPNGKREARPARMPDGLKEKDLIGIPWRVAFALQADGWYLRSDIIWAKTACMPESVRDRCTSSHEYLFMLTKKARYYYDADAIRGACGDNSHGSPHVNPGWKQEACGNNQGGSLGKWSDADSVNGRNKRDVWTIGPQPFAEAHFATYPEKLVEPCVLAGCPAGGIVLDPFTGSGTTGAVACRLGRKFVGIELSPEYAEMAERRIAPHRDQMQLVVT